MKPKLAILLSAYALEPHRGSEPGLGWLWASELSRLGHDVTVLTSGTRHGEAIETFRRTSPIPFNIEYIDFRWPAGPGGAVKFQHLHYVVWQLIAGWKTRRWKKQGRRFDVTHHVTWASLRYPILLAKNGLLVIGPLGGAEIPNRKLLATLDRGGRISEWLRWLTILVPHRLGVTRAWMARADVVALTSKDNCWATGRRHQRQVVAQSIALYNFPFRAAPRPAPGTIKLLYIGRLVGWKGVHLAIETVRELLERGRDVSLTVTGDGPWEARLRQLADRVAPEAIDWVPWLDRDRLVDHLDQFDLLVFPSMHDSGGMVVLEAMARGMPVVALDVGGPGVLVSREAGVLVNNELSPAETITKLADGVEMVADPEKYASYSLGAIKTARQYDARKTVSSFYGSKVFEL